MKKSELWTAITAKNPSFNGNENVTLSASGLRKLFELTWSRAEEYGRTEGAAELTRDIRKSVASEGKSDPVNAFKNVFGGGFEDMFGAGKRASKK